MRTGPRRGRPRYPATEPGYSLTRTVTATALLVATVPLALLALSSPWTAAAIVGAAVAGYAATRALLRRRRDGRTKPVCVPHTDVCVGV